MLVHLDGVQDPSGGRGIVGAKSECITAVLKRRLSCERLPFQPRTHELSSHWELGMFRTGVLARTKRIKRTRVTAPSPRQTEPPPP
jgi:hypothetical protein